MKHTRDELKELQKLPLNDKIALSKIRIQEFHDAIGGGEVAVSFSGGKDSTALLNIVRELYPETLAVFCDTGLEFPEIRSHVKTYKNVKFIYPKMNFKEVVEKHGWVYPSKIIARTIRYAKANKGNPDHFANMALFEGKFKTTGEVSKMFTERYMKWNWLVDVDIKISEKCCDIMKKEPFYRFQKETGYGFYVGTMASESEIRKTQWINHGCNMIDKKISKPISFWTEQDVLKYLAVNNIKIASVYGRIIEENGKYKTTGESRTGCCYCPVSLHLENPNRIQRLKQTHPDIWKICIEQLHMDDFCNKIGVPYE